MRALQINFVTVHSSLYRWGYLLLVVSVVLLVYEGGQYFREVAEWNAWEQSWKTLQKTARNKARLAPQMHGVGRRGSLQVELKAANRIIVHLSLPWDALFRAIDTTMNDQITLLGIEPDTERKELRITAEARHFDAVLVYMRQLYAMPILQEPYVLHHQIQSQNGDRPIRFVIVAKWLMTPVAVKNNGGL